ncbi:MAG: hypothetical protein AABX05_03800 [Nanoarchaeota archaeon]
MLERKLFYDGNSEGFIRYHDLLELMKGKGQRIPMRCTSVYRKEIYVIEPATTMIYKARKRIVPKGLDLWHVKVELSGYRVVEVEEKLRSWFSGI